eukprot:TRINITY_DN1042_c0_g1_i1.p1 TRINITY_DN1042_c0_g1~~TRINITY_DN1042_c0_g1_i1.p1  ORF type:complete len:298 (+),score=44.17 TRINITY_DN1042_c0_g1_i1:43-936(+)
MSDSLPWYLHYLFAVAFSVGLILVTDYCAPESTESNLLGSLVQSILGGLAMFNGGGWLLHYLWYYKQKENQEKWKIQPKHLSSEDFWHAYWLGTHNIVATSIESGCLLHYFLSGGKATKLFWNINEIGVFMTFLYLLITWLFVDMGAYYVHKWLHIPVIYRNIHKWHHRYKHPVSFTIVAMSPIEAISLSWTLFLPVFVIPCWAPGYVFLVVYNFYFGMLDHSGIKLDSWLPWQNDTVFHDRHHEFFHVNYGQNLQIWDQLNGTVMREDRYYDETTFGGKGALKTEKEKKIEQAKFK